MANCPRCENGSLKENKEWDEFYDRLDMTIPAHDLVIKELRRRGIPQHSCNNCDYKEFAQ